VDGLRTVEGPSTVRGPGTAEDHDQRPFGSAASRDHPSDAIIGAHRP
jgi:hypothetical protein